MKKFLVFLIMVIAMLAIIPVSSATFVDFEELDNNLYSEYEPYLPPPSGGYNGYGKIPTEYGGLTWDTDSYWITKNYIPNSGYQLGTIDNVSMFNGWGRDVSLSLSCNYFSSIEMYITAALTDEKVAVEGWKNNILLYTDLITAYNDERTLFGFNIPEGINTFKLRSWSGRQIVVDNIVYSTTAPVPIPCTLLLLGSGIFGIAGLRRLKR